jgi:hypothetical protein
MHHPAFFNRLCENRQSKASHQVLNLIISANILIEILIFCVILCDKINQIFLLKTLWEKSNIPLESAPRVLQTGIQPRGKQLI